MSIITESYLFKYEKEEKFMLALPINTDWTHAYSLCNSMGHQLMDWEREIDIKETKRLLNEGITSGLCKYSVMENTD